METKNNGTVCDEQVFSSIFKANSKTVFNYIYYKFGNEEKSYDAVQEAFVKLWEKKQPAHSKKNVAENIMRESTLKIINKT